MPTNCYKNITIFRNLCVQNAANNFGGINGDEFFQDDGRIKKLPFS